MRAIVGAWLAALVACGGGDEVPADAAIDAAPPCFNHPGTKRLRAEAGRFGSMGSGPFGGMICVEGHPELPCTTAESNKQFSLCVPDTGDYEVRLKLTDWEPAVWLFGPGMLPPGPYIEAGDNAFVKTKYWDPIGAVFPPTTNGNLTFFLFYKDLDQVVTMLSGATLTITPTTGLSVVYQDDTGDPDPQLTATSSLSGVNIGNVPPGMYDIKVTSSAAPNCHNPHGGGYASPVPGATVRVPAIAGANVAMFIECTQ
jgi:hypothetical protein